MGRKVLTVEPFYDNIKRIHKAAVSENIGSNIKLVRNAITNKRHEIMLLQKSSNNIGGQAIDHSKTYTKEEMATNKYLVETILMDDLVDQIPLKADGKKFTSAILKIDIEGSEPFAFKHAEKFFDALDIQIIFMEWGNFPTIPGLEKHVDEMIDFLMERSFLPYVDQRILLKGNWKTSWPWDIIWKKKVGK
jgi:FkbM family methyltransferase